MKMARRSVKVSKEIDFILCDFVERNPPLWNPEDKNYHKSEKREELFQSLSEAVKIPGEFIIIHHSPTLPLINNPINYNHPITNHQTHKKKPIRSSRRPSIFISLLYSY